MPHVIEDDLPDRTGNSKYDWQEWADGRSREFAAGEDYTCSHQSFRTVAYDWAAKHGFRVRSRQLKDAENRQIGWQLQFVSRNGDSA
jgi:hypothetical protein